MAELNHTIVHSRDKDAGAAFLCEILGLPGPTSFGPFRVVRVANGVDLDYLNADPDTIVTQHYAFLVSDDEFDAAFDRITARGGQYWADPGGTRPGEINTHDGGRGLYFDDPSGHRMELITVPYGGAR
ncbi:VOC family protein [Pseudonocardia sp. HH130629-09]|uniref:VOC family protein n=1 Tax=Pseudonocardia sp. HH130629-09 TaxID=1641402 RepID=UPI0006CB0518|nr:VOC family protein [Pseudonocardia sp. HH130629-09]ALE82422.1 glyoxalase/bleomycin resistance protein/dioxygenase [Pseudonocardia sp. HH130629-09]